VVVKRKSHGSGDARNKTKHVPEGKGQAVGIYPKPRVYHGRGGGYPAGCVCAVCGVSKASNHWTVLLPGFIVWPVTKSSTATAGIL